MAEEQIVEPNGRLTGRVLGGYVLRERIGNGGYGEVYRAEHLELRCTAVIKVMTEERLSRDETAPARFRREAQLASRLRHSNAAQVYDFGVAEPEGEDDDEVMWIAMEFVPGVTFSHWLNVHGPMSLVEALKFFKPLFKAVDAAHRGGIIHRDLKPSNVMVIEDDVDLVRGAEVDELDAQSDEQDAQGPVPKLIDFGVAKGAVEDIAEDKPVDVPPGDKVQTDLIRATRAPRYHRTASIPNLPRYVPEHRRKITGSGDGVGSRPYMAPEQWGDAAKVTAAADIYSLGVMLCEALTGRLPILPLAGDDSTDGYRRAHLHGLPEINLPEDVRRVLGRALSKVPEQRQSSARELGEELEALLKADPNSRIRSLSQRWNERGRSRDLLARGVTLMELKRSVQSVRVASKLSKLDDSYIKLSLQHARRAKWAIGALVALLAMGGLLIRAEGQRQTADQFVTRLEVDRGQQALLHGELSDAVDHLEQAYQRGDRSPGLKFMLARALQPRMSELARFKSGSGRMWSAAFSPDGKRVLTSDDQGARMWDAASSQLLFTMNHGDTVYAAAAVFSPDGSKIVTAGADGNVRIWTAARGSLVRELRNHRQGSRRLRYYAAAVSSRFVAAIELTGKTVHVWDVETGTQVAELDNDAPGVALVAFSSDGRWLASSGANEVRVFDTLTWRQALTIDGPRVRSLSFDPAGPRLAVGTYDGTASIWEIPTGARVRSLRDSGGASVDVVAFSRDGTLVAAASRDGMVQVWNAASGGLRTQFKSHRDKIYAVEFSATGDVMLSAGADGAVVVSNVITGMPVVRLEGSQNVIVAAHFDQDSRRVVGASWDGTARVWDAASPYRRWASPAVGPECDTAESLAPDQRFIAISCANHGTRVWDTARGEILAEFPNVADPDAEGNYPAVLTANGDQVAISRGRTVDVFALPSGQLLRTVVHSAAVNALAFGPAGHDLVSGAADGSLLLTMDERAPVALPPSPAGVDATAILADGRVVVADANKRLRVISPNKGLLMDLEAPSRIRLLRTSRDGSRLVTISTRSEMGAPALWDLDQRRLVGELRGHVGRVFTARFVGEGGHEILTVGSDGIPRLWDGDSGASLRSFPGDGHVLVDAVLAPDGSMVVAGGSDGFLRFWDTSNGRLLWMQQAHTSYVVGVHYEGNDLVTRGLSGDIARWAWPSPDGVIEACRADACRSADPRR